MNASSLSLKRVGGRKGSMLKRQRSAMTSFKSSRHSSLFSLKDSDVIFVNQGGGDSNTSGSSDDDNEDDEDNEVRPEEKQSFSIGVLVRFVLPMRRDFDSSMSSCSESSSRGKKGTTLITQGIRRLVQGSKKLTQV